MHFKYSTFSRGNLTKTYRYVQHCRSCLVAWMLHIMSQMTMCMLVEVRIWFVNIWFSCGLLLFKLQPTKQIIIEYVRKKESACLNKGIRLTLSKSWCREPRKLWQIQQVGLPQKARFSNRGTCTDNFSRRTDVNQHTLVQISQSD